MGGGGGGGREGDTGVADVRACEREGGNNQREESLSVGCEPLILSPCQFVTAGLTRPIRGP